LLRVVGRYANPRYPEKSLEELQHLLELARSEQVSVGELQPTVIRNIKRRLGRELIAELVAAYESGVTTIELMQRYDLSKTSVLKLLREAGVTLRRQPMTSNQVEHAQQLYESGNSLATVAEKVQMPTESVRRSLLEHGVQMRPRQGR
jgi:Mor family transcriptional regulator